MIRHNNQKCRTRTARLKDAGGFRTARPRDTWERVDAPKFAGEVHQVDGFKGANVEDDEGKSYPVKTVLAVPAASQDVDLGIETGPGGGRRARQREMLQDYATNLTGHLPSTGFTLARVGQLLRGMRGFQDTADVYGSRKTGRIVNFLKLYPKLFSIHGSGPKIKVFPAAPPSPKRRVQCKSAALVAARHRLPESERNVGSKKILAPLTGSSRTRRERDMGPILQDRGHRHARYEAYKVATTLGEARRLGATSQDISLDVTAGALTLL